MEYKDINTDIVERTLSIIDDFSGEFEVTLLLNCCVGLLVVPKEKHWGKVPKTVLTESNVLWGLDKSEITFGKKKNYSLNNIVRRMRNSVCHFNIETVADSQGNINKVVFRDKNRSDPTDTAKITLTCSQLKTFVVNLAQCIK